MPIEMETISEGSHVLRTTDSSRTLTTVSTVPTGLMSKNEFLSTNTAQNTPTANMETNGHASNMLSPGSINAAESAARKDSFTPQNGTTKSPALSTMSSTATFCTLNYKDDKAGICTQVLDKEEDQSIPAMATKSQLDAIQMPFPGEPQAHSRLLQDIRWRFFSTYRKIFTVVYIINIIPVIFVLCQLKNPNSSIATYQHASTAAAANLCAGILMRNEHVVNICFRVAGKLPHAAPLWIRRQAAKVYSYGGVHSATAVAATTWYLAFCGLLMYDFCKNGDVQIGLAITAAVIMFLLFLILLFAYPSMRMRYHDAFERIHRFAGWTAVACFWTQTILAASSFAKKTSSSLGRVLLETPSFWFLIIITCCIIYPWTRLRSREVVKSEVLSKRAVRLHFNYTDIESCAGVRLTDHPLMETHAFATIPNRAEEGKGYSILMSNAGDWTRKIIHDPPTKIFVKGAPTLGVIRVSLLFKKVLVIATGSGIGPCLSFLQSHPDHPVRVLWSAPNPWEEWGGSIFDAVHRADPEAVIVNTKSTGRPDLPALAYGLYKNSGCEAVVIIANPVVTKSVVFALESHGVPAYGAIFDS